MVNVKFNKIRLCSYHHREDKKSPHKDIKKDLEYKRNLQAKYEKIFSHNYYTIDEIKLKLEISYSTAYHIVKTLRVYSEGFQRTDIIKRLMGGRLYELDKGRISGIS